MTPDFSDKEWVKAAIRYMVDHGGQVSFADLAEAPGVSGPYPFGMPTRNVVFWPKMSQVAIEAMSELIKSEEVGLVPCHPAVYDHSSTSKRPDLPLVTSWGPFSSQHFAPMLVVPQNIQKVSADA